MAHTRLIRPWIVERVATNNLWHGGGVCAVWLSICFLVGCSDSDQVVEEGPATSTPSNAMAQEPPSKVIVDEEWLVSLTESRNPGFVGANACQACHEDQFSNASQTRHFAACRPVTPEQMPDGFAGGSEILQTPYDGLRFEMRRDGNEFWLDTIRADAADETVVQSRFDLILGSGGKFDDVFLHWDDQGWMWELPVVWLYPSEEWATSHFDPHGLGDHSRPLTVRCLECPQHLGRACAGLCKPVSARGRTLRSDLRIVPWPRCCTRDSSPGASRTSEGCRDFASR